jgi:hypothetical protein
MLQEFQGIAYRTVVEENINTQVGMFGNLKILFKEKRNY